MSANAGVLPGLAATAAFLAVRDASWIDVGPLPTLDDASSLDRFSRSFADAEAQALQHPSLAWAILAGVAVAALVVLSVLIHELAHAWAARRVDVDVETLQLGAFGGFVTFHDDDRLTAGRLALIVVAGPAATAVLVAATLGALLVLGWPLGGSPDADSAAGIVAQQVLGTTFLFNAVCLGFNLIPLRPLDGGHLLSALRLRLARGGR